MKSLFWTLILALGLVAAGCVGRSAFEGSLDDDSACDDDDDSAVPADDDDLSDDDDVSDDDDTVSDDDDTVSDDDDTVADDDDVSDDDTASDDDDTVGDDDTVSDDDDTVAGDCADGWIKVIGTRIGLCWETVFPYGDDVTTIRTVGYGAGGNFDWSYTNGLTVDWNASSGYVSVDLEDFVYPGESLFRVTMTSANYWAEYTSECLNDPHFLSYTDLSHPADGFSLCGNLSWGVEILDATDAECAGTY